MRRSTRLRISAVVTILMFSLVTTSPAFAGPAIPNDVRDHVKALIDEGMCPGIAIGIIDESGPTFFSLGNKSVTGDGEVDEKTIFEIGSISKAFTATLLCDMAQDGVVALDDPISKYLPKGVTAPNRGDKDITLRILANHRSSLPRMPDNFAPKDPSDPYVDYTPERMFDFLKSVKLERDVDSKYEYSNFATGLLGQLLVTADGKRNYNQLLVERISKPLKLNDTALNLNEEQAKRYADGSSFGRPAHHWGFNSMAGAGAINSTARDMLRFIQYNMGLKDCELSDAMKMSQTPRYDTGVPDLKIALGWHIWKKHDAEIIWHNGGTGGFHSFCGFRKDKKIGVVVLTNASENIDDIGLHLLEPKFELSEIKRSANADTKSLDDYVGWYLANDAVRYHVSRNGDQLLAQLSGQEAFPVFPESKDRFFYRIVEASLSFQRDGNGKVTSLTLHQNGVDRVFEKQGADYEPPPPPKEAKIDAAILKHYVGRYRLAPGLEFDVTESNGQLFVKITGQPNIEVYPESETVFFYKVVDAKLTFVREGDGPAKALILHQHGMDQRANRIAD